MMVYKGFILLTSFQHRIHEGFKASPYTDTGNEIAGWVELDRNKGRRMNFKHWVVGPDTSPRAA